MTCPECKDDPRGVLLLDQWVPCKTCASTEQGAREKTHKSLADTLDSEMPQPYEVSEAGRDELDIMERWIMARIREATEPCRCRSTAPAPSEQKSPAIVINVADGKIAGDKEALGKYIKKAIGDADEKFSRAQQVKDATDTAQGDWFIGELARADDGLDISVMIPDDIRAAGLTSGRIEWDDGRYHATIEGGHNAATGVDGLSPIDAFHRATREARELLADGSEPKTNDHVEYFAWDRNNLAQVVVDLVASRLGVRKEDKGL